MDSIEIAGNPSSKIPIILLVDNSASMGIDNKISMLSRALAGFKRFVEENEVLSKKAEICLVTFGNRVTVTHDFSSIHEFFPPALETNGPSLMGAGILKAQALLMARKYFYRKNNIECLLPQVIFFGGSEPDDFPFMGFGGGQTWDVIREAIRHDISHREYVFTPYAVIPSDIPYEISACKGEVTINYSKAGKVVVFEENGEVRSLERENDDDIKIIDDPIEPCPSLSMIERQSEKSSSLNYIRAMNTFVPFGSSLGILKKDIDTIKSFQEVFLKPYILNDITPPHNPFEISSDLPSSDTYSGPSSVSEGNGHVPHCAAEAWSDNYSGPASVSEDDSVVGRQVCKYTILSASTIGPLHIIKGIPCQDAFSYKRLPSGHTIITIADGLGSASMSEIGSRIAVEAAIQAVEKISSEIDNAELTLLAKDSVIAARRAIEEKADALNCSMRDLACTFISVLVYKDTCVVAHIGDGAVVVKKGEDLIVASEPGDSEYANEVTPLTSKKWEESLTITPVYSGISGIMAFSDGIHRAALRKIDDRSMPYGAFCAPLFSFAEEITYSRDAENELKEFLSSKKMSDHSEDDKTLIFVTIS